MTVVFVVEDIVKEIRGKCGVGCIIKQRVDNKTKPMHAHSQTLKLGAGGGIRARDFWASGKLTPSFSKRSPDYESGALTRLGNPGSPLPPILGVKA